jgi:toxin FitB
VSRFLLDTNVPSEFSKPQPNPYVLQWLGAVNELQTFLSVVSLGEMRKGCELLEPGSNRRMSLERWLDQDVQQWLADRILPINEAIAERWGKLEAKRQRLGRPLNTADGQIAATAIEHNLIVVTRNVQDFEHLEVEVFSPWRS